MTDRWGATTGAPSEEISSHRHGTDSAPEPTAPDGAAVAAGLRRRRAAALRCAPLPDGRRDPADLLPTGRLTARERGAWAAAAAHLRAVGCEPVIPEQVSRAGRDGCGCCGGVQS